MKFLKPDIGAYPTYVEFQSTREARIKKGGVDGLPGNCRINAQLYNCLSSMNLLNQSCVEQVFTYGRFELL
ncbi:unnamed protein product, partial [Mesorhabditis belari]|uniref:Uncharacterized protein n=1 Tax=Mesorhabditis belari TaxID=2138241 RepID=A0AAF3ECT1_9BILA